MKENANSVCRCTAAAAALILLLSAVSCGSETDAPQTQQTTASNTLQSEPALDENDPFAQRMSAKANLPADGLDFGGAAFRTLVNEDANGIIDRDIYVPEASGDLVDDALYNRQSYVEEQLNVKITPSVTQPYLDCSQTIRRTVNAGEDAYDVFLQHMIQAGSDALQGIFQNWYDIPHMKFDQPWYSKTSNDALTVDGVMYLMLSDIMLSSFYNTYCIYYNKDIAQNYDLPDLYSIVKDGKWTMDQMETLSKNVYMDLNGDGKRGKEDQYGYATSIDSDVVTFFWAFDVPLLDVSGKEPVLLANNDRAADTVTRLRSFLHQSDAAFAADVWTDFIQMFVGGQVLFIPRCIGETMTFFREMNNYGILPFPKYDEAQPEYRTMLDGCSPLMAVPKTATQLDLIGAVMEAMGEYSYKYVVPAYYDVALKVKGTRDENSIEMLDLAAAGRKVDFGFVFDSYNGFSFTLQDLLQKNDTREYSSYYAKREKKAQKHYQSVYDVFVDGNHS